MSPSREEARDDKRLADNRLRAVAWRQRHGYDSHPEEPELSYHFLGVPVEKTAPSYTPGIEQTMNSSLTHITSDFPSESGPWRVSGPHRLLAGTVAVAGLWLLSATAQLTPSATGTGTHEQLGLPTCGMLARTGNPCPTCGMTTAFAWMSRGRIDKAFLTQPAGAVGALTLIAAVIGCLMVAIRGVAPDLFWLAWNWRALFIGAVLLVLLSWIYRSWIIG